MTTRLGGFGQPGLGTIDQTTETEILFGGDAGKGMAIYRNAIISGTTRDAGNTPTTVLRGGLLLGVLTTNGQYTEYDPAATDGSEIAQAILPLELRAQDFNAVDAERVAPVLNSFRWRCRQGHGDLSQRHHLWHNQRCWQHPHDCAAWRSFARGPYHKRSIHRIRSSGH